MKKLFCIFSVLIIVLMSMLPIKAVEINQDGLEVTFTTDKKNYEKSENIQMVLNVKNCNDVDVTNVSLNSIIPEGYKIVDDSLTKKEIKTLKSGETITLNVELTFDKKLESSALIGDEGIDTGDNINIYIMSILVVSSFTIGVYIVKKKNGKKVLLIFLCIVINSSLFNLYNVTNINALETERKSITVEEKIKVEKKQISLKSIVYYDQPTINDNNYVNVNYAIVIDEFVKNKDEFKSKKVKLGDCIKEPNEPISQIATFEGWYTDLDAKIKFNFSKPITEETTIYAKWDINQTDSDGDGVADVIEDYYHLDKNSADSDGDGLSDYNELYIGTDPLKKDTDGDGVSDYDEDTDLDSLTNGEEVLLGTDPTINDTDRDGLIDKDEIYVYKTDPKKSDTDEDGADDGWEVKNGYNPLLQDQKFEIISETEPVTEYNLVSASVEVELTGEQLETLNVTKVDSVDNPLVSSSVPGYLGSAYDFSVDGQFEEAILQFDYNLDEYGEPSDTFQPRIYYVNEETQVYEELGNQVIENGKVKASVSHFSTYILLNKIEFDKVWESEIKPPEYTGEGKMGLDVVLAIDSSGSMIQNDYNGLRKNAAMLFAEKLTENDRAAVIDFDSSADVVCGLTNNIDEIKNAINKIDSTGGTDLYDPVSLGINVLMNDELSSSKYKYIILLTDGEGYYSSSISQVAKENDIQIYTIGLGNGVDEKLLQSIAEDTGGKYYFATSADDLLGIYEETANETIDYVTDSNNDGISDYYTKLIYDGTLRLGSGSNKFKGIDLNYDYNGNLSDDYDNDGLKNGEELIVEKYGDKVYLKMISNPLLLHSDSDGISDNQEIKNGTSPLMFNMSKSEVDILKNDDYYNYSLAVERYSDNWIWQLDAEFLSLIFGVWNKEELYRDIYIDYFSKYTQDDYLNNIEYDKNVHSISETLDQILSIYNNVSESDITNISKIIKDIYNFKDDLNGTRTELIFVYEKFEEIVEVFELYYPNERIEVYIESISIHTKKIINVSKVTDTFFKGLTYTTYVSDILDTISSLSKVNTYNEAFAQNIDILENIYNLSGDARAKNASYDILQTLSNKYDESLKAIVGDASEITLDVVIGLLGKSNIYVTAVILARDAIDVIIGISSDLRQQFEMMGYNELSNAIRNLFNNITVEKNNYYQTSEDNKQTLFRYLVNIAQVRILGEKKFCEWVETEGIMGWFTGNDDVEKIIEEQIKNIKIIAEGLNLYLDKKI